MTKTHRLLAVTGILAIFLLGVWLLSSSTMDRATAVADESTPEASVSDASAPGPREVIEQVTPSLSRVLAKGEAATAEELMEVLPEAQERYRRLAELVETDPQYVVENALPMHLLENAHPELQPWLEQPFEKQADFNLMVGCGGDHPPGEHPAHEYWREVWVGTQAYKAFVYGRRLDDASKMNVFLNGVMVDGRMALAESPARRVPPGDPAYVDGKVTLSLGGTPHTFDTPEAAAAFEQSLLRAEANSDGPHVSYPLADITP